MEEKEIHSVLLLASYCDDSDCTDELPCLECLKMCNTADIEGKVSRVHAGWHYLRGVHPDYYFDKCVDHKVDGEEHSFVCKLGLWGCYGEDEGRLKTEAIHYWAQYFEDGEYNKLICEPDAT